jgi:rhamnogalacturonyl hydrolase YesR
MSLRKSAALFVCISASTLLAERGLAWQVKDPPVIAGDSPDMPGPFADDISPEVTRNAVHSAMRRVADWQLGHLLQATSRDWTYATLYEGLMAASESLGDRKYEDPVIRSGMRFDWHLGPRRDHADDQVIGESYLRLFDLHRDPKMFEAVRSQFDAIAAQPDTPGQPTWWWSDALFMGPPAWEHLSVVTGDKRYRDFVNKEWKLTDDALWSRANHLYSRDQKYLTSKENNGEPLYWARGNGWVLAGLAQVLKYAPKDDPHRTFYLNRFKQLAESVALLQCGDGLWRPGLLNQKVYSEPDTSASAFFIYGMAWGMNEGVLDKIRYRPIVSKGWKGLVKHIYADGRLGSVQPVGEAPEAYSPSSSYVYGVGAFLMAGAEVGRLASE